MRHEIYGFKVTRPELREALRRVRDFVANQYRASQPLHIHDVEDIFRKAIIKDRPS